MMTKTYSRRYINITYYSKKVLENLKPNIKVYNKYSQMYLREYTQEQG